VKDIIVLFFVFFCFGAREGRVVAAGLRERCGKVWCGVGSAERYEVRGALLLARREVEKSALKVS
jgi:hypothetical protein